MDSQALVSSVSVSMSGAMTKIVLGLRGVWLASSRADGLR